MTRKICVITGTRADYGILRPVLKAIEAESVLELRIVATCMHLMAEFGATADLIESDGFEITARAKAAPDDDNAASGAVCVGDAIAELSVVFADIAPDVVMILGDRGEVLAAAVAAVYLGIPVAHLHGGEISGHVDGIVRHAITKLSHIHFCATDESRRRILNLGEEPWRVHKVGAPALDTILATDFTDEDDLVAKYNFKPGQDLILVLQHPVADSTEDAADQMTRTLEAVTGFKKPTIIIYPNADAGGRAMIDTINRYEQRSFIRTFKSIPHRDYLGLLRVASVLVGNSSSAIIEAPSFGLPAVNIGTRQQGRQNAGNCINTDYDTHQIARAIQKCLCDSAFKASVSQSSNPYGDGHASERIVAVLEDLESTEKLLAKKLTY